VEHEVEALRAELLLDRGLTVARISGLSLTLPGLYTPCTLPKVAANM
jgi:hypothetical protein